MPATQETKGKGGGGLDERGEGTLQKVMPVVENLESV